MQEQKPVLCFLPYADPGLSLPQTPLRSQPSLLQPLCSSSKAIHLADTQRISAHGPTNGEIIKAGWWHYNEMKTKGAYCHPQDRRWCLSSLNSHQQIQPWLSRCGHHTWKDLRNRIPSTKYLCIYLGISCNYKIRKKKKIMRILFGKLKQRESCSGFRSRNAGPWPCFWPAWTLLGFHDCP